MMHQIALGPPQLSRAEQRRLQLLEIEMEQRREEQEAMGITEEQKQILIRTFKSVKVEFSDLDGLQWTAAALRTRQRQRPRPKPLPLSTHTSQNLPTKPLPSTLSSKRKAAHGTATSSRMALSTPLSSPFDTPLATPLVSPYHTPLATPVPSPRSSLLPDSIPSSLPMPTTRSYVHEAGRKENDDYPW